MNVLPLKFLILLALLSGQSVRTSKAFTSPRVNCPSCSNFCGNPTQAVPSEQQSRSNWKQCTWKNTNDDKDNGEVHECLFIKERADTYLRVVYQGNLRVACKACCKRWFFTFNKRECTTPAAIDALVYQDVGGGAGNIHRSAAQEGYCGGIGKGIVRVGFSVGNCVGHADANAYTSWNSVSRIVIEEVDPPQA